MKIKINELESYELTLPETISGKDFFIMMDKLERVGKLIKNSSFESTSQDLVGRRRSYSLSREQKIEIMKAFYTGTPEEKKNIEDKYGLTLKNFSGPNYWSKHDKIEAKEIGLIRFPRRGESRGDAINKLIIKPGFVGDKLVKVKVPNETREDIYEGRITRGIGKIRLKEDGKN